MTLKFRLYLGAVFLLIIFFVWFAFLFWLSPKFFQERKVNYGRKTTTTINSHEAEAIAATRVSKSTTTTTRPITRNNADFKTGSLVLNVDDSSILLVNIDEEYDHSDWFKDFDLSDNSSLKFEKNDIINFETNSLGEIVEAAEITRPFSCTGKVTAIDYKSKDIPFLTVSKVYCKQSIGVTSIAALFVPVETLSPLGKDKSVYKLPDYTGSWINFLVIKGKMKQNLTNNFYAIYIEEEQ